MNLVLISGSAPDSHDPTGGQWIIQPWGLQMIQQDWSGVRSAFGWSARKYWLHIELCNWPKACIVIQPDSHPNWACETGPHLVEHGLLVDLSPWSPRKLFLPRWFSFLPSENGRWNESHACPCLLSQHRLLPLHQGHRWFRGTRNDSHVIPSWCVWGRTSSSWVNS